MNMEELRQRLAAILDQEERGVVDWASVEAMFDRLDADLKDSECPHFVYHFISDSDIRAKDPVYGDHQRQEVRRFVETGEYVESKAVSPLGCIAVMAALGGLAFWVS
jgi:hypothetical protein